MPYIFSVALLMLNIVNLVCGNIVNGLTINQFIFVVGITIILSKITIN